MSKPRGNHSRDRRVNFTDVLQAFATHFQDGDDDTPDAAESSQSSGTIDELSPDQILDVYMTKVRKTTKVRETTTNPTRQVNIARFAVSRDDSAPPDRQVNLALCDDSGAYITKQEMQLPASSARRILSSSAILAPSTFVGTPETSS